MGAFRAFRTACALVLAALLVGPSLQAQVEMPDPRQMSGIPRPVTDLPDGSVSVRLIKGDLSNNLANHPVELQVDGKPQRVNTDAEGRAQFDRLPAGATLKAVAVVDGERLESQEFPAPGQGAIRLMLVATDPERDARKAAEASAPAIQGQVILGGESRIVFYILDIMNNARAPMNPPVPFVFDMPEGAVGTGVIPGSANLASNNGRRVTVSGPFPPGKTSVEVGAALPVDGPTLEFTQTFPALYEQPVFIAKKDGAMTVRSAQFDRQQDTAVEGTPVIIGAASAIPAGTPFTFTISGLPYRSSTPRLTALALALLVLVVGAVFAFTPAAADDREGERRKLAGRREKLLHDLTRLEQEHRRGRIDDGRFAPKREELIAALESVYAALDTDEGADPLPGAPATARVGAGAS